MTDTFYLVRGENRGEPESFVFGLYTTADRADERVAEIEEEGYEYVWYDEVQVGDLDLCNR